ncbi:MAG: hypothetical protein JWO20_1584 [Candidatus Angelobacter sp.]|jgi:hypothetical protein|nr:hypothetical protein [Candidatus Angelobacter sp.]
MKIRARRLKNLLLVCSVLLLLATPGAAQNQKTAHATIPFGFWIGDSQLPAGDYQIEHEVSPNLVFFRLKGGKTANEAYMLPVDEDPVKESDFKLVFRTQNGEHHLYEVWGKYGKRILTAAYGLPNPTRENRVEIPMVYR